MEISSEAVIGVLTKRGALFRIEDGALFEGDGHHKFVVCNQDGTDDLVIMAVATSQYQHVYEFVERVKLPLETVVVVPRGESEHFPDITAFNCNSVQRVPKDKLAELHRDGKLKVIDGIMPPTHMDKIEAGICASPQIEPEIQDMVRTATESE